MIIIKSHDLAGLGTHYQDGHIFSIQILLQLFHIFLDDLLHFQIDGCDQIVAVGCRFRGLDQIIAVIQICIGTPVSTVQFLVIITLESAKTFISADNKSQQVTAEFIIGIDSGVIILKPYTDNIIPVIRILKFLEGLHLLIGKPLLHHRVKGILIFQITLQSFLRNIKVFGQRIHRCCLICLLTKYVLRLDDQIVNLIAGGQNRAVSIQNITPPVRNGDAFIVLLTQNFLFVFCAL